MAHSLSKRGRSPTAHGGYAIALLVPTLISMPYQSKRSLREQLSLCSAKNQHYLE
ncbi:hypothetical protein [Nostoc sp.]|uniref:hypothetical protein n=1 Tax=Nostoc sp. TaxID=1180 RepID=UPI00359322B5